MPPVSTPTEGVSALQHNPANMVAKEFKLNPPTAFSGDRKKLKEFLIETEMYLTINREVFDTDEKKIIFALSYMREGTAGPWK